MPIQRKRVDTKVREELGLDPNELGSAGAQRSTPLSPSAWVPQSLLLPFLLGSGEAAFVRGNLPSHLVALFVVGAAVSIVTGPQSMLFSGVRQVAIGAAAAAVTYAVGSVHRRERRLSQDLDYAARACAGRG